MAFPDQAITDNSLAWLDSIIAVGSSTESQEHMHVDFNFDLDIPSPVVSPSASSNDARPSPRAASSSSPPAAEARTASDSAPAQPTKPPRRRIRPKIALDSNQPLTARGKPRARVYVACNQWCV